MGCRIRESAEPTTGRIHYFDRKYLGRQDSTVQPVVLNVLLSLYQVPSKSGIIIQYSLKSHSTRPSLNSTYEWFLHTLL